jgi:aspartyl-tRNA(Asn)/glutamyl-tRNA(Gln) amidotransferase subunit A
MTEAWRLGVGELSRRLAARVLSPVALLEQTLNRIARINPKLNAIVAPDPTVRDAAKESERRLQRGEARGVLEGIPFTIKDNILAKGMPATWGSALFADFMPDEDELPVARLRNAGAIVIGKTNVPELTLHGYTSNALFGTTGNPWNPALTPGGSSGGAVASVAAGLVPFALGTDGGGSIRRPAAHTGLVGLKPSIGRVARHHSFPQILLDCEVIGPIARSVADAALVFDAIKGRDARDRRSLLAASRLPTKPCRIRYVAAFGANPVDKAIATSVARAARVFAELGHRVEEGPPPFDLAELDAVWAIVSRTAAASVLEQHAARREVVGAPIRAMAEEGACIPATQYLGAIERMNRFRGEMAAFFESVDVVMTPSAAAMPWPAAEPFPPVIDGKPVGPRGHAVFTAWVNMCGHPGLNLPSEPAPSGLPIGFQLVAPFGADEFLLELGRDYEAARPWSDRWPDLADG